MKTTAKLWPIAWNRSIRQKLSFMIGLLIAAISGFTGHGLAISKTIVEEVGGRLHIQSSHGRGTTLTISLPPTAVSDSPTASQG